jgi:HEAT repeat protein
LLDTGSSGVKIHTIDALSQIEDGRVVSLIVSMFDDSDENVRSAAQQAIEHLKRIASS